jgi:hypothetical protein
VPDGDVPRYDHTKPVRLQQAPLKPEYQALFEASIKDQDSGGFGLDTNYACLPQTMPRLMNGIVPFEFLVSPEVMCCSSAWTIKAAASIPDGRQWPKNQESISTGYSIGQWLDTDGDGRFDTLAIEIRNIRGPKTWDQSGIYIGVALRDEATRRNASSQVQPGEQRGIVVGNAILVAVSRRRRALLPLILGLPEVKILLVGLFALALVTAAMCTGPMSAGTVVLVTVQTLPTPPDWRAP